MAVIGIDFGGTEVKLGIFAGDRLVASDTIAAVDGRGGLDRVADRVEVLLADHAVEGVGIAVPGIIDPSGSRLLTAHGKYSELRDLDLSAWAERRFGRAAVVEIDARAALVGEVSGGVAHGARDAVLIVLGTGIGTAAFVDGRVMRGGHGHAAVLGGHVTVDLDGPRCPCGNIGCAEAIASTWALAEDASAGRIALGGDLARRFEARGTIGIRDLVETRGEVESAAILDRYLRTWAAVVVAQCHAFDPEVIVVTGGVLRSAEVILPALRDRVHADLWSSSFRPPFVSPADPSTSVLRGLAVLARELEDPTISEGPK